jgi:hypothetical protein
VPCSGPSVRARWSLPLPVAICRSVRGSVCHDHHYAVDDQMGEEAASCSVAFRV